MISLNSFRDSGGMLRERDVIQNPDGLVILEDHEACFYNFADDVDGWNVLVVQPRINTGQTPEDLLGLPLMEIIVCDTGLRESTVAVGEVDWASTFINECAVWNYGWLS